MTWSPLDPTGTVYFRTGHRLTFGDLFNAWGQPLTRHGSRHSAGSPVRAYVNGHARNGDPRQIQLTAERGNRDRGRTARSAAHTLPIPAEAIGRPELTTSRAGYPDYVSAATIDEPAPDKRRWLVLGICCMSLLIIGLDVTIVNVALPAIHRSLESSLSGLQWTIDTTRW